MPRSPAERKVLLIGWDAADWKVITPLVDAGRMPHLARFLEQGSMGNLATLFPILSPMLWTSIATGKRAHKHGIHGFAEPDPEHLGVRPVTNLGRRCKAVWNILHQEGLRSQVIGWWPSHPAEPIRGVMVSNHFQSARLAQDGSWPMARGAIHPPGLTDRLARLRVHPREIDGDQLLPFVPRAAEIDQAQDKRLLGIAKILAETASVQAAATALLQLEPWDFCAVYFDAIDHFCHGYMRYRAPRLPWIPERDFELYKDVVDTAYRFHDLMLGALLEAAGADTTVIIVSDHGFHPDHLRPRELPNEPAGPADEHRPYGVFAIRGAGIRRDHLVHGANLLDVTPTILALFGLPQAHDMDGKPLLDVFEAPPQIEHIDSWDSRPGDAGLHAAGHEVDPIATQQAIEQLVELGYIERPDEDRHLAMKRTARELRFNLARDLMGAARFPEAERIFSELWDEDPTQSRFGVKIVECHLAAGRAEDGRRALERLVQRKAEAAQQAAAQLERWKQDNPDRKPDDLDDGQRRKLRELSRVAATNPHAFAFLRGRLAQVAGEHETALGEFDRAKAVQMHQRPSLHQARGNSLIALGCWHDATQEFEAMLAIDPVNAGARMGLGRAWLGQRRPRRALVELLAAVGLEFNNPLGHYYCGLALRRLGRRDEARRAFETAVSQSPIFADAYRALARMYRRQGDVDAALRCQQLQHASSRRMRDLREGRAAPDDADLEADLVLDGRRLVSELPADAPAGPIGEAIVVVSGLPRSGTSMMMQALAGGGFPTLTDGLREADADNPRGYFELEEAKALTRDNRWLPRARGKAVKIVAPLLHSLSPEETYRIIFMERPLGEVIDSQRAMLERQGHANAASRRHLARAYVEQIRSVRRIVHAHAGRISTLPIAYHDMLADPERVARQINDFVGGGLSIEGMVRAVEPSLRRQFGDAAQGDGPRRKAAP